MTQTIAQPRAAKRKECHEQLGALSNAATGQLGCAYLLASVCADKRSNLGSLLLGERERGRERAVP